MVNVELFPNVDLNKQKKKRKEKNVDLLYFVDIKLLFRFVNLPWAASIVAKQRATAGLGAHASAGVRPSASIAITLAPNSSNFRVTYNRINQHVYRYLYI